ncbi:MAG: FkbM family methyltransferase [Calothrix sp. MO_167.B12]|nr:FkbM family methyltransferase [Calothrix sp. MO_167.B12]
MKNIIKSLLSFTGYGIYKKGWEPWGISLETDLERLGTSKTSVKTIIDGGANVGNFSTKCSRLFPEAKIYAFEPVSLTFAKLKQNMNTNNCIHTCNLALSNNAGKKTINLYDNSEINSLENDSPELIFGKIISQEEIQCVTLDEFSKANNLQVIDLVKLDLEGHELAAIEGMKTLLHEKRVKFILIEVKSILPSEQYGPGLSIQEVSQTLLDYGYRLNVLYTDFIMKQQNHTNFNALYSLM